MNEDVIQQSNNSVLDEINNAIAQRQQDYSNMTGIGYDTEQYLEQVQYPTPQGSYINYGADEYIKDAFTSWVTGLNQAQYSADMGKFMLAQDEINDLQNAEKYLNAIGEGFDYSSIDPSIIDGYTRSMDRLGLDSRASVDEQYNRINQRIVELTEDQNGYLQDANTDLQDLQDWQNKWEISDYYKQKEAEPTDYTIDSLLYKLPGIMGSSSSSVGWQALGMLGSLVGTAGSIALAPVTGGGSVLAWGALAVGAAASLTGNIMAGRDENAAEVYDNLKDAVTQDLSKNGNYNDLIKQGRSLLKEGINAKELNIPEAINSEDVDKMTDDRVMDYILNGTVNTSNSNLERAVNDRLPATGELYLRDMATTVGTDILTTAIDVLPIGILSRGTRLGRWGVNTYAKMKNSVLGSKLATKLDQAVHFGLSKEAQNVIHRKNIDFAYNIAKRNMVSALAEGPGEEGIQYLNGQDFINGKYGQETPSWVGAYVDAMIDKAQSVWAFMMPFDAAEKYDDEWLENSRSGLLMGIFNFPSVIGNVRDIAQNVRNNQALRTVQDGLIQRVFEDKTQWNQAKYFADRVDKLNNPVLRKFTSGETAINDAFNAFSDFMPDEFTQDMWQAQRDIFNNVRNLAKSKTVRQLAEQRGFNSGSEEYNTYLALLEYKRQKRAQALEDNKRVGQEVDKEVSDIRNRSKEVNQQLFDLAHANAKIEAANRIVELYENQQEDAEAYGVRVNKRDLVRAKQIAKEMRDRYKDVAKKNENDLGFVIASSVELPTAQEDLVQAEMKRLFMDIDLQVHTEDYNSLYVDKNGSPRIEYIDENGKLQSRELTNTEKQKAIDYSKETVQRFINVDKYNRKLQQDLRTGGEQNTTTEIAIPDEGNNDNNVPPVAPPPSPEPQVPTNPTPTSTPPAPTSEETKPEVEPEDTTKEQSSQTQPTQTTSQPTDNQPVNEPSAPDQLPPMPDNAVIPGVGEEPSQNASESDSQPLQGTQTPSPEQDIVSEPESSTEPQNASTDVSTKEQQSNEPVLPSDNQNEYFKGVTFVTYAKPRVDGTLMKTSEDQAIYVIGKRDSDGTLVFATYDKESQKLRLIHNREYMADPFIDGYINSRKEHNNIVVEELGTVEPSETEGRWIITKKVKAHSIIGKYVKTELSEEQSQPKTKPETLSKEKIKELNDKLNAVRELAYEELKDPKYNDIANKDLIQTLRTVLSTIDVTVNENSDPSIEQDVDNYINNIQNLLEQLRNEYQKYLENKAQTDVIDTYSKGGYSLVIKQEDQAKSIRILNADDLLDTAEINVDGVDENGYPQISISYKGETLHATLLYSDRQDPSTVQKYPELVNKLRSWLELVRQNPNKYKIIPIGLQRTNGMLIKQTPGQTINMTQVSFWSDVLKGYGVVDPTDPYQINENNFILAIVDQNSNLRRQDEVYGVRKQPNKGWGDVFWIARIPRKDAPGGYVTHRVMINPTRLNQLKGSAEVIVEALRQFIVNDNPTAAFMQNGKESPFTPTQVLNLLTYFNNDPEYDKRLSPQENQWRMNKSIAYYANKGQIKIADKIFDVNTFLSSEDVRNQVVQMLYSEQYQFHIPIYEDTLKGMYGADFVRKENPLAPLHRFFEMRPGVRKYELFPGMDFTPDMAGLGKHKDGINWLGYMVSRGLINPGYTAIQNRVYASDFQLIQAGNDTDTQESNTIDTAVETDEHTDEDSGNPFADAFGGMDLNFTSRTKPEMMTEDRKQQARSIIAKLTDLSEDQVQIIDDIIATVSGGMHVMGRAKLDSIVLSGYDIPGIEYHEAWHRISNLLMSPQQREKVFRQVRKKFGKNLTDTEVDEILAERFREFQLDTAEVIDYNTTNLFKRVWNFIRTWARLGSLRLARIYYTINTGGYSNVKPSAENVARFKALYQNEGPNFTFNGADFKQFANRYALNRAIDSLMYYVFYNPKSKVSFYKDAENINFLPLYQMLKRSKNPALQELAQDDNWNAVKQSLTQRLQQLSIRVSDVEESELENLADSGALAKVNMDDYTKASYEIDVFGNQTADVKFFLSTVPQYAPDYKTGIFKPVLDEVTGLPKFYDVRYIWNVASTDLGKCKTLQELLQEVDRLSATDYMYAGIRWKLNQYLKLANSEDEATRTDAEGSLTRILTAIRKQRLQFDTVRVNRTEEGSYSMSLVNNTVDNKTRILPSTWSQIFLNQSDIFSIDDNNNVTITESGRKQLRRVLAAYNSIKSAFQNNGIITIGGEQYDLHVPVNQSRLKNYLVNMFALIGIHVEQGTINQLLKDPKYGQDSYTKLYNLFNRGDINYGGIPRLFQIIQSIADSNNVQNVVIADKATPIGEIYNKLGFVNELAVADVIFHTNHDNLMEIGAGNNLIYSKSDNNFISDRTDQLNANDQTVEKLLEHPWNHYDQEVTNDDGTTSTMSVSASIILSAVQRGVKLRLSVLQNFKTDNYGDQGSDYQQINDIEDYIAKMELVLNNRIIFPTMEAKKTYYSISGVQLPYGGIIDVRSLGDLGEQFIFSDEILDRYINYFQADYNSAMTTISQLTEGSPDFIPEDQRITNYHTKVRWFDKEGKVHYTDPNGTRMRMFTGMYTVKQGKDGKLYYEYIHFDDPNKSSADILRDAKARFFDQPIDIKRSIVNKILSERLKDELQYCINIGLIEGDVNDFRSIKSSKLDQNTLMQRTSKFNNNAHAMGVIDVIADTMNRSMISFVEVQKAFVGDPAFFKWTYDEQGLVENTIDLIKRHGGLISTGINNRIDLDDFNPTYRVAELKDYKQGSDQLDYLLKLTSEGYLIEFVKQQKGISEAITGSIEVLKQEYPELWDAAQIKAKADFGGYKKGINVADAAVYITPEFYARLMRSVGEWNEEIKEAYEILQDDNSDWYSQSEAYGKIMKASFRALKYVAYGTRFENGNAVPYFNKMALFPVFKNIATGDMSKVYERMTREDNGVDMLMFESAVKVGSKHPTDVSDLDNLVVYDQDIQYLRQQLNTKGHPEPHINVGTQMLKVALGNLDMQGDYNGVSGESIKQNIMSCINNLSDRGVERLNKQFLDEFGTLDVEKFARRMQQYLQQNPGNDNLVNAVQIVEDPVTHHKRLKLPISALSDASFLESVFLSMINSETVDINMPGGAFIQRSAFGVYDSMNIVSDSALNHGKKLKMIDEKDGSMHCIVSITLFRDLLPNFDNLTFAQQKKALLDAGIIGENSEPIAIGYRIPTQAQASISALKVVDVLPAVMEDTIILPEEFTKLTGSDFDDVEQIYTSISSK